MSDHPRKRQLICKLHSLFIKVIEVFLIVLRFKFSLSLAFRYGHASAWSVLPILGAVIIVAGLPSIRGKVVL